MGRKRTGSARYLKGCWRVEFYDAEGKRRMATLRGYTRKVEDEARAWAAAERISQQAAARVVAPARGGAAEGDAPPPVDELPSHLGDGRETFAGWCARWLDDREHRRGLSSARDDRSRMRYHVMPALGRLAAAAVGLPDAVAVVRALDDKARAGAISKKTAQNVWVLVRRAFREMSGSKRDEFRVREDNPTDGVEGPDRHDERLGSYLYPDELLKLLACDRVPIEARRLYALAAYTGLRRGELAALRPADVSLAAGYLAVHKAMNRKDQEKKTKTGVARRIPIEREARPLLAFYVEGAAVGGRLVPLPSARHLARSLRAHLRAANVLRPELFAKDGERRPLTFHDLRGTTATWMAVRGDEALKIQRRLGHKSLETTQRYIKEADVLRESGQTIVPFPPLPPDLCGGVASPAPARAPVGAPAAPPFGVPVWRTYAMSEPEMASLFERETGLEPVFQEPDDWFAWASWVGDASSALKNGPEKGGSPLGYALRRTARQASQS